MCEDCCPLPDFSKMSENDLKKCAWFSGFNSVENWARDLMMPPIFERLLENSNLNNVQKQILAIKPSKIRTIEVIKQ